MFPSVDGRTGTALLVEVEPAMLSEVGRQKVKRRAVVVHWAFHDGTLAVS